jgi:hypothetical protein
LASCPVINGGEQCRFPPLKKLKNILAHLYLLRYSNFEEAK